MKNLIKSLLKVLVPEIFQIHATDLYRKWSFRGNRFACPFCEGNFGKMLPTGMKIEVWKEKDMLGGVSSKCAMS